MKKYYIDTAIWIDLYEGREGFKKEPLGEYALRLLSLIKATNSRIIISDFVLKELEANYSKNEIIRIFTPFEKLLDKIFIDIDIKKEAKRVALQRNIPMGDVLHALICKEHNFILITRDKHFKLLRDISQSYKPEEIFRHP